MTTLAIHRDTCHAIALPLPGARTPVSIRLAEAKDVPFIDQLQRKHARAVGWFPTKQIEGNIAKNRILIAEENGAPVGYCISNDRYHKHDDCGIVYQLNVVPDKQRGLIGATLIKAVFDRAAYGCKLFCCWCAHDLQANHFWESIGFVPLAFRTGSRKAGGAGSKKEPRIHIFWQRRIREGDSETPYWFPSETTGGALRENRLVLPIPPGTHWSDAKPAVLPGMDEALKALPGAGAPAERKPREKKAAPILKPPRRKVGVWFAPPEPPKPAPGSPEAKAAKAKDKPPKPTRVRFKNDPKMVAAARELRDRYIEQINAGLLLPPSACGKYDVSRQLAPGAAPSFPGALKQTPLLKAA